MLRPSMKQKSTITMMFDYSFVHKGFKKGPYHTNNVKEGILCFIVFMTKTAMCKTPHFLVIPLYNAVVF